MGVFASSAIKEGERVAAFRGKNLLTWGPGIEPSKELAFPEGHYLQVGPTTYMEPVIDSFGVLELVWYVNHSCEPNLRAHFISETEIALIAVRDIAKDEELTWDYSTTMLDPEWKIKCNCRKPKCRGIITEFAGLPSELKAKYRATGGLPWYLKSV